ncbi:MAG: hypothetical protein HY778_16480 [Betaproteobacteria bacterium]|nr:hypothetical protein [Betaproteobacteria bacterium]
MDTPDPRLLVLNAGKRLRCLADSKDWSSARMRPLRRLFEDFAFQHPTDTVVLRQLIEKVGARHVDGAALAGLTPEHGSLLWRGYYGAPAPESPRELKVRQQ